MSYNDRIEAALVAINQHNDAFGAGNPGFIIPEDFIQCIKISGGTSEERLADFSYEDLLNCMPSVNGVKPVVLAKQIAKIFRQKDKEVEVDEKRPISNKKADKMLPMELVQAFDPEDYDNPVGKRLKSLSKGQKFIVYESGRNVDVNTTFKILSEIKQGFPGREDVDVNGQVKKVYALGELPDNYADENPIYYNRPLRPDGTCDQLSRSWEGVDLAIRQFIRVAIDEGELEINHEKAHDVLDSALQPNALQKLRQRYRKSALVFDELAKTGKLPTLKILLGNVSGGSERKNPFQEGKKVEWKPPTKDNINKDNIGAIQEKIARMVNSSSYCWHNNQWYRN
jgi:hypothetical protein